MKVGGKVVGDGTHGAAFGMIEVINNKAYYYYYY